MTGDDYSDDVTEVVSSWARSQSCSDLIHGAKTRDSGDRELITRHQMTAEVTGGCLLSANNDTELDCSGVI